MYCESLLIVVEFVVASAVGLYVFTIDSETDVFSSIGAREIEVAGKESAAPLAATFVAVRYVATVALSYEVLFWMSLAMGLVD